MINKVKKNKIILSIILPLLLIIINIAVKISLKKELKIDALAYNILVEKLRNPTLTAFMKIITKFSNTITIILLTLILTILFQKIVKNKKIATLIPTNLVIITLINQLLKIIFQRERPIGYRLIKMGGYSFPSGHAMVSMAFYGLLIYIIDKVVHNKKLKILLISLNVVLIILIGISRVYLGVHYLSDVITGYSVSIIYLLLLTKKLNKYKFFP